MITVENGTDIFEIKVSGVVTAKEYEEILIPAIQESLEDREKLNVLYHVDEDFDSYEFMAMIDDAKAGIKFFKAWSKIAVVSDTTWITNSVKAFSFIVPGEIKTFSNGALDEARKWLSKDEAILPAITITLAPQSKTIILEPKEILRSEDFIYVNSHINPFIEEVGTLNGIILYSQNFPGWDSFSALFTHLRFIKDHHKKLKRLAFVTDSFVGAMGDRIGSHFIHAEVKNFPFNELDAAKAWILEI